MKLQQMIAVVPKIWAGMLFQLVVRARPQLDSRPPNSVLVAGEIV